MNLSNFQKFIAFSVIFWLLAPTPVLADSITIDVTVKAIDTKSMTITVAKVSGPKEKTLQLDISKKAKISINGKDAPLGNVRPGQKAVISYDSGLEVVSKIEIGVTSEEAVFPHQMKKNEKGEDVYLTSDTLDDWETAEKGKDSLLQGGAVR